MKFFSLLLILFISIQAQTIQKDSTKTSDINSSEINPANIFEPPVQLPSLKIDSKYVFFQNDPTDFFVTNYMASETQQLDSATLIKMQFKQISADINNSMMDMYNIKHGNDPTLLRQVLGTIVSATAVGLAGYHVYKYNIKKEK